MGQTAPHEPCLVEWPLDLHQDLQDLDLELAVLIVLHVLCQAERLPDLHLVQRAHVHVDQIVPHEPCQVVWPPDLHPGRLALDLELLAVRTVPPALCLVVWLPDHHRVQLDLDLELAVLIAPHEPCQVVWLPDLHQDLSDLDLKLAAQIVPLAQFPEARQRGHHPAHPVHDPHPGLQVSILLSIIHLLTLVWAPCISD